MEEQIINLGFKRNTSIYNGFRPHFQKGNDLLFIIGGDYWISKIVKIEFALRHHNAKIYGVLSEESPILAKFDWVTADNLTLLKLDPPSIGQWNKEGTDIEYIGIGKFK